MEEKYLPIGTVCTVKGINKKVMIISYFSIEYNNNVIMYDYKGCTYPEGLLLPSQAISFNHNDIVSVDFIGYKNDQFEVFNNNLNREHDKTKDLQEKDVIKNFQFDENGVVIFDPTVPVDNNNQEKSTNNFVNPFKFNGTSNNTKNQNDDIFGKYEFDENGIVINDNSNSNQQSKYEFDENGFVVSDNTSTTNKESLDSKYAFDENGVVTGDNTINETKTETSKYKFDENGVVIEEK